MILLLDNFDSFTYNLRDYLLQGGERVTVVRNTASLEEIISIAPKGIVLSPGPGKPTDAGNLMAVIEAFHHKLPILGICLGHQAIGEYFGGKVEKAKQPMHGKISAVLLKKDSLFQNMPKTVNVVRYHSLLVNNNLPACLEPIAKTKDEELMGLRHKELNIKGLQFHPEAVLTEFGKEMILNWILNLKLQS